MQMAVNKSARVSFGLPNKTSAATFVMRESKWREWRQEHLAISQLGTFRAEEGNKKASQSPGTAGNVQFNPLTPHGIIMMTEIRTTWTRLGQSLSEQLID